MKRIPLIFTFLVIILFSSHSLKGQGMTDGKKIGSDTGKPLVFLLGTFHFQGEMVDDYQPQEKFEVNMLLPERQKQIEDVLDDLEDYRPTIIAIEAMPEKQTYYDSLYQEYLEGRVVNEVDERISLGFELAKRMGLKEVICIDAKPYNAYLSKEDSLKFIEYSSQPDSVVDFWGKAQGEYFNYDDSLIYYLTLKDYLLHANSDSINAREFGYFLVGTRKGTNKEPMGADGWITKYYNRNVRIYSNVQRLGAKPSDRILIIYGAMHLYILKHLFKASPEFELVPITKVIK
jgi:hypothetical protein